MKLNEFMEMFDNKEAFKNVLVDTDKGLENVKVNIKDAMKANNWSKIEDVLKEIDEIKKDLNLFSTNIEASNISLSKDDFETLEDRINNPPEPNDALKDLFKKYNGEQYG